MQSKLSKRKAFYIALSVLVAVSIWIFVDLTQDGGREVTKTIEGIPIEYLGEDSVLADRGLMLLEDGTDATIDLTVKGSRWNIARLDPDGIIVQVNLADVTSTGTQRIKYNITYPNGLGSVIGLSDASTYMARVNIGELNTRTVELRAEYVGSVAEGYTAGELTLSPAQLEIRGQAADIDPVSYAKVTINLDDADTTFSAMLDYQFYDAQDNLLENSRIHATVEQVQATLPVNVTKELRLVMDFTEAPGARAADLDFQIEPATITVTGDAEQLRNVTTITLAKFDLTALNSDTLYNYTIPLPSGCENLSGVTTATLRAAFRDRATATLTTTAFSYENLPEGKEAVILTEELPVTVFGKAADVAALTAEDLTVVADLTDFSAAAGSYTVPATVQVKGGGDIGVSGTYQVRVTIREIEEPEEPAGEESPTE